MPGTFTYDDPNKKVTVTGGTSGSPADFPSWVTADRAGSLELRAAGAPGAAVTLTTQIRPCELRALLISFIVAGKTAEADYLFITGTDFRDNAQTESIDVSAGNGTYVSALYWRTITNIDCSDNPVGGGTVWADGTLAVTQPMWGSEWDKGNGQGQNDALLQVGDGSTATYFKATNRQITYPEGIFSGYPTLFSVKNNAILVFGSILDEDNKITRDGVDIIQPATPGNYLFYCDSNGVINLYSCKIVCKANINHAYIKGRIWNCLIYGSLGSNYSWNISYADVFNTTFQNICLMIYSGSWEYHKLYVQNTPVKVFSIYGPTSPTVLDSVFLNNPQLALLTSFSGAVHFINCESDSWVIDWAGATKSGSIYRQYTLDLKVSDKDNSPIVAAAVKIYDKDGNLTVDTTTDANGEITQQALNYIRYYYDGAATATQEYYPYHLVISKAGYETYEDKLDMDRKMDMEVALRLGGLCYLRRR